MPVTVRSPRRVSHFFPRRGSSAPFPVSVRSPRRGSTLFIPARVLGPCPVTVPRHRALTATVIPGADPRHRALSSTGFHTGAVPRCGSPLPRAYRDGFSHRRGSSVPFPSPRAHRDGNARSRSRLRALTATGFHTFFPRRGSSVTFPRLRALTMTVIPTFYTGAVPRSRSPSPRAHHDGNSHFYPGAGPRSPFPVSARSPRR